MEREIRISQSTSTAKTSIGRLTSPTSSNKLVGTSFFKSLKLRKATKRRYIRTAIIAGNVAVLVVVATLVLSPSKDTITSINSKTSAANSVADTSQLTALDQLASASIAQEVAKMTGVDEATAITNQADTERLSLTQASLQDSSLAFKPQVIESAFKSNKDIQTYIVKKGDTVTSIAKAFGVTSNSIRWSNGLGGDTVKVGKKVLIPPVNGIVRKVKKGDTPASLAAKYDISKAKLIAYNDAELHGLTIGELIILPGATIEQSQSSGGGGGGSYSYFQFKPVYGYNGYAYGFCTWYVASRISIPVGWGNANSWDWAAEHTPGFVVNKTPTAGSILQDDGSLYGTYHVAYVESVSGGNVYVSEMNVPSRINWGRVTKRVWSMSELQSRGVDFIHKL